ncbi:MAG TPA: radical SAM protein, partial [Flavipsychrobacter sp.]|nr:radical SAM protein [Flavipsychrobacter sp.]
MAGIYIHIPFCKQACTYCNFHFSTSLKLKEEVIKAIMEELRLQTNYLQGASIETIYFGGGTPSLLSADEINLIFEVIQKNYPILRLKEFTLEANPDDLTPAYLKTLRNTSVDRLSIGTQSFRDSDLQ